MQDAVVPAGQDQVRFTVTAPENSAVGVVRPSIVGKAVLGGREVVRRAGADRAIILKADEPPKGVAVRRAVIAKGKNEATVTVTLQKQVRPGTRHNIILTGTTKLGKESFTAVVPAIPFKVVGVEPTKQK